MKKGVSFMNKKYSIGFLIVFIALIGMFFLAYRISYHRALDKYKEEEKQIVQNELEICYYIQETDGYVMVYEADKITPYEYTSILVEDLPENIQHKLKEGIKFTSLSQVYGFLENYSS